MREFKKGLRGEDEEVKSVNEEEKKDSAAD